jgi:superfamily II DNA or RNA helicase
MALIDNFIRLEADELKRRDWARLRDSLTFYPNPQTRVEVWREKARTGQLWLPRGIVGKLPSYVERRDKRSFPKLPKLETKIVLDYKDEEMQFRRQKKCLDAMFNPNNNQCGVIHRQPGTGKTQIALEFIARVGTRTLVIVHTNDILEQWIDYAETNVPDLEIGIIRGKNDSVAHLTMATVQTLFRRNYPTEWWRQFGATFLDECHHAPAETFDRVIAHSTSRYRFGMSASKTRADHMEPLVELNFGPIIHDAPFISPVPVTVQKINTSFTGGTRGGGGPIWLQRKRWQGMIKRLVSDERRNALIAKRVNKQLKAGRSTLVLSRRIDHLQNIQSLLDYPSEILAAKLLSKPERTEILDDFREGKIKCVLATQLADEALNVPILSCIALVYPGKHSDKILQQVGRALREYKGKDSAVILDFVDKHVKTLRSHWHHRRRAYLKWGFKISGGGLRGYVNPGLKKARNVALGRIR